MQALSDSRQATDADKIKWQQSQIVAVLFRNVLGAIIGNLINVTLVTYLLSEIYPGPELLLWCAFGYGVNLFRLALLLAYRKNSERFDSSRWLNSYRVSTLFSGLHFGVLCILFFSPDNYLYQALVIFFVGGSCAAAVGTNGVDHATYRLFLIPSALPLVFSAAQQNTEVHSALAIMAVLLVIVLFRAAQQTRDTMLDNINMSYSLNYRATHDSLVPLLNREEFRNQYERISSQARKSDAGQDITALLFVDLDNFKLVNDNFGHDAGDQALLQVSDIIRASIRKSDIASRFGGDEFMILIRTNELNDVMAVANKILTAIGQFEKSDHTTAALGASIGIAYSTQAKTSFSDLFKLADQACYRAKRQGKGQLCIDELKA